MKVDNPRIHGAGTGKREGFVLCEDCPLDEEGRPELVGTGVCCHFRGSDGKRCPTRETYAEACALADAAAKEAK